MSIDALRGLAALGVALFVHFRWLSGDASFNDPGSAPLGWIPLVRWLYVYGDGLVDLFFVLSGFIFCHVYRPDESPIRLPARQFFVYRLARLYPILVITTVVTGLMLAWPLAIYGSTYANLVVSWSEAAKHLLFLKQATVLLSMNAPAWSLSVEATCYVLFYLIARLRERYFLAACCGIVLFGLLTQQDRVPFVMGGWWLDRGLVGFFVGCLLQRAMPWILKVPGSVIVLAAGLGLVLGLASLPVLHHLSHFARLSLFAWPPLVALSLRPLPTRFFDRRPFLLLGDLSYSVYLWHTPVGIALLLLNGQQPYAPPTWPAVMIGNTVIILLISYASFRWIEEPARRYFRGFAKAPPIAEPPLTAERAQAEYRPSLP